MQIIYDAVDFFYLIVAIVEFDRILYNINEDDGTLLPKLIFSKPLSTDISLTIVDAPRTGTCELTNIR